jgi:sugar phosphate isomerase/epimerase
MSVDKEPPVDRLAGTTWTARHLSLEDALDVVREAGLRLVEVWADGVHLDPRTSGYETAALRRALGRGLSVVSVHLPFDAVSEGATADVRADDWVHLCKETLHRAAELGARTVVAHPVIYQDPAEPEDVGVFRLAGALGQIADAAAELELRLAVENMHDLRGPTLHSVAEILTALDGVRSPAGLCLDVGHAIFNGYTGSRLGDEVRAAGQRLLSTHVHDSDKVGADPHLVPGEGIADWPAFTRALFDIGYTGRFVLEVNGGPDPVERLIAARARFSQILRETGCRQ